MVTIIQKKFFLLIVFIILSSIQFTCSAQDTYSRMYDFEFRNVNEQVSCWKSISCVIDSTIVFNGKQPLMFNQEALLTQKFPVSGRIFQQIWLPHADYKNITLSVNYKCLNIQDFDIIINKIDKNGYQVASDTINMPINDDWKEEKISTLSDNADAIILNFKVSGVQSLCSQGLWLDKMDIALDDKNIDEYPIRRPSFEINKEKLFDITSSKYSVNGYFADKRILAIGESIHGCEDFNDMAWQIIKQDIVNGGCDLVLLEIPLEAMFGFNNYILGIDKQNIDSLIEDFCSALSLKDFKDFIIWLKDYNKERENKVQLLGFDVSTNWTNWAMAIKNTLFNINREKQLPVIDSLIVNLQKNKGNSSPSTNYIISHYDEIKEVLGETNVSLILQSIKSEEQLQKTKYFHRIISVLLRDSLMAENVSYFEKLFNPKKVILYSHSDHVGYNTLSNPIFKSFGWYMREKYGNDYGCMFLLAGTGEYQTLSTDSRFIAEKLSEPIIGSVEYALNQTNVNTCLYLLDNNSDISYIRLIGRVASSQQFKITDLKNNCDAVIYFRNVKPVINDLFDGKTRDEIFEKVFAKYLERIRKIMNVSRKK